MDHLFFVGILVILFGLFLFAVDRWSKGSMKTQFGRIQMPVWFLVIDAGFMLMVFDTWLF